MSTTLNIEQQVERNYRFNATVNILDGTFFWLGASFIAGRTILQLYVSHFTDSSLLIGLLSTMQAAGWLLPQLFTATWVQRLPRKKDAPVKLGLFTDRLPIILLAPAAALLAVPSPGLALFAFFVLYAWHVFGAGTVAVGWQDMIAKVIPIARRGRFFGITNFGGTGTGVLGAAAAAWLLDRYGFPRGYVYCFAAAAIFVSISWFWLALTREPIGGDSLPPISQRQYFRQLPGLLHRDLNFRRYLSSQVVGTLSGVATGFVTVYAVQRWHLPDGEAGAFTASMLIGQSLCSLLFGPLADRKGHKLIIELGMALGAATFALAFLAPAPLWFHLVFALTGAANAAFMLSGVLITFEFSSSQERPTYIGLNNTIIGIASSIAPLLGGLLAGVMGYQPLFIIAFVIEIIGLSMLHWWVREPRNLPLASGE